MRFGVLCLQCWAGLQDCEYIKWLRMSMPKVCYICWNKLENPRFSEGVFFSWDLPSNSSLQRVQARLSGRRRSCGNIWQLAIGLLTHDQRNWLTLCKIFAGLEKDTKYGLCQLNDLDSKRLPQYYMAFSITLPYDTFLFNLIHKVYFPSKAKCSPRFKN